MTTIRFPDVPDLTGDYEVDRPRIADFFRLLFEIYGHGDLVGVTVAAERTSVQQGFQAVDPLTFTPSADPTQAEVELLRTKVNEILLRLQGLPLGSGGDDGSG